MADEKQGVVSIDGVIYQPSDATISVLDRGFLYGDSVYEVVRTYDGNPFALRDHLERLRKSASSVDIELPISIDDQEKEILEALRQAGHGDWYVRTVLTRGGGPIGLDPALAVSPRRVVIVAPIPEIPNRLREEGASIALVPTGRSNSSPTPAGAKTGNYLNNIMALSKARAKDAFEAVMIDGKGRISEGTTSNVFIVSGDVVRTPPLAAGILDGITRRKVIGLGEQVGIDVREVHLRPLDVYSADEVFLTATLKEIMPVVRVDEVDIGNGQPGPVTRRLQELFRAITRG